MNWEKASIIDLDKTEKKTNGISQDKKKTRVDINILLNKVRAKNKKEKYENYILFTLLCVLVIFSGIIISL